MKEDEPSKAREVDEMVDLSSSSLASLAPSEGASEAAHGSDWVEPPRAVRAGTTLPNLAAEARGRGSAAELEVELDPVPGRDFGRVIAGRYRIIDRLAQGGMGAVYLAEHVVLRAPVALKLLQPQSRDLPELVARFEREAIVGAHVKHPNIAAATDFGTLPDGSCYLVLELVEGTTLEKVLRSGRLAPERAASIALQIADALSALHERGVLHRDLKPSNVMLVERTGSGRQRDLVKVIDFGLARLDPNRLPTVHDDSEVPSGRLTTEGVVFGTVAYLAPEAMLGMNAVDERSDLYALGLVLYRMLAGRHPFEAMDEIELFRQQVKEVPPTFASVAAEAKIAPSLEAIVRRLLEKDPAARFPSAASLVEALSPHADGSAAGAERSPSGERRGKSRPKRASAPEERRDGGRVDRDDEPAGLDDEPADPTSRPALRAEAGRSPGSSWRGAAVALAVVTAGSLGVVALARPEVLGIARHTASALVAAPPEPVSAPRVVESASATASASAAAPLPTPSTSTAEALPYLARARFRSAIQSRVWSAAFREFQGLIRDDPGAFATEAGRLDAVTLLGALAHGGLPEAEEMTRLLAFELGPAGHDALFHVLLLRGGTKAHPLVVQTLRDPMLRARLSPPLAVALRLYQLGCDVSTDVYAEAVAAGDARALMTFGSQRERCRKHEARERAYRALEKRLVAAQGGASK